MTDLAELKALAEAATPGPWMDGSEIEQLSRSLLGPADERGFVKVWPNSVSRLLDALAAREQEVAELRAYAANDPHGWAKASLMSAGPGRSGFELLISTPFGAAMVEHLAAALASADAPNFLSVSASSPELGEIELTIQRAHGKTTAQTLAELREDVARLREGIASAEKWLRDLRADLQGEGLTDYAIAVRERADKLAALASEQSNG